MIRVFGAFLCGKDELEWTDQLERLKTNPLNGTLDVLELSYTGLEKDLKDIFLDVACFLKSLHKDDVVRILESCGFNARIGLRVLEQKSLITISDDQYVGMHDCIQEMGRNIVRRLHPDDPSKHSRLWIREEIEDILANDLVRSIFTYKVEKANMFSLLRLMTQVLWSLFLDHRVLMRQEL